MKEFFDEETSLKFVGYSGKDLHSHIFDKEYEFYNNQLNEWSKDKDIKKFIVANMNVGRYFKLITKVSDSTNTQTELHHFFIFDNDQLIGSAVISTNEKPLYSIISNKSSVFAEISKDKNCMVDILYFVTNPKLRGLGYGTRIIKTIKNHEKELTNNKNTSGLFAEVRKTNEPSKKAFLKNNFIVIPARHIIEPDKDRYIYSLYDRLYHGVHAEKFKD